MIPLAHATTIFCSSYTDIGTVELLYELALLLVPFGFIVWGFLSLVLQLLSPNSRIAWGHFTLKVLVGMIVFWAIINWRFCGMCIPFACHKGPNLDLYYSFSAYIRFMVDVGMVGLFLGIIGFVISRIKSGLKLRKSNQ